MKKLLLVLLTCLTFSGFAAPLDLTITGINPLPPQVVAGSTIPGLTYNLHNNNTTDTFPITFSGLNSGGLSYTTTCGNLAPGGDCTITISLVVTQTLGLWTHPFYTYGAHEPVKLPYVLVTTVVPGGSAIAPTVNVVEAAGSNAAITFTITFTGSDGIPHEYDNVGLGVSTLSPSLAPGTYTAHIAPPSYTDGGFTWNAPADAPYHLAQAGDKATFNYTKDNKFQAKTNLTMPNVGSATSAITFTGPAGTFGPHDQGAGISNFDMIPPGTYTVTAANYTGTDAQVYIAALNNPYQLKVGTDTVALTYAAKAPSTEHVHTVITAPGLAAGATVAITLANGSQTYGPHNQAAGDTAFDTMVDGSYDLTCAPYTVGPDTYACTPADPYVIDSTHVSVPIVYVKQAPPGTNYDWHVSHVSSLASSNMFAVWLGGGSTTGVIKISSNPEVDTNLVAWVTAYELAPVTIPTGAYVKHFPHYVSMGTILENNPGVTTQLSAIKLQSGFHYEGNGSGDRGAFWDGPGGYTPQVDDLATQEKAVFTASGNQMTNGVAFYTIDYSDGFTAIIADTENDTNVTAHQYNLMYEAQRMEYQYGQGNPMVLLLNPDATEIFQNCGVYNCPTAWKPGIFQSGGHVIAIPNLQADTNAAIDRMVTKGYLTSGQATAMKNDLTTSGILTPPVASGRTVPGIPELVLTNSWIIKYLATDVPFGLGNNEYDSANPLLAPAGQPAYETASFDWLHKIQHSGLSPEQVQTGIQFEAQKYANFMKDMNFVGNLAGLYKPDFLYFDRYERDVSPGYVPSGFLMNGPDWDYYTLYINDIEALTGNLPWAYWQMGGATLHTASANYTHHTLKKHRVNQNGKWVAHHAAAHHHKVKLKSKVGDTIPVSITVDAPNLTGTVSLTMQDSQPPATPAHTYTHSVGPGTSVFDSMYYVPNQWATSYWAVGANYTGSDGKIYWPVCENPYSLGKNTPAFSLSYRFPVALTTTSWTPHVGSATPSITIEGGCYTYTQNLAPGTTQPFMAAVVPDTYSATGASYADGTTSYFFVPQLPLVIPQTGATNMFVAYGRLGDTFGNWFFGDAALNNDMSNLDPDQSFNFIPFTATMNNSVYYTKNSGVKNAMDYLKLTNAAP